MPLDSLGNGATENTGMENAGPNRVGGNRRTGKRGNIMCMGSET